MWQTILVPHFLKQLKRHLKKHRDLKEALFSHLEHFNKVQAVSLGHRIYKMRLALKSLTRGKSGSFRLVVLLVEVDNIIVPVAIYFKGEQTDISQREINDHLEAVLFELRIDAHYHT